MIGRVIKAYGGYYYVEFDGKVVRCYARGKLRQEVERLLAGDLVEFTPVDGVEDEGVIEEVLPRKNQLIRPPVANIDQVLLVFALTDPQPIPALIDRMLVVVGASGLDVAICFNKRDLISKEEEEVLPSIYRGVGYRVMVTSAKTGEGCEDVKRFLEGKISIFAGPSGVGKSALLNSLNPDFGLETGELSRKIRRGKHTTRVVQFLPIGEKGLVADSPGFTSLNFEGISPTDLTHFFPEIERLAGACRFSDCLHRNEPGCAVREGVLKGEIYKSRYESYLRFYEEIEEAERGFKR